MLKIAALIWVVAAPTLSLMLWVVALSVPSLAEQGMKIMPMFFAAGLVVAIPFSYVVAKKIVSLTPSGKL